MREAAEIVKRLQRLPDHSRAVFDGFTEATLAMLESLPRHARALEEAGRLSEDPPEVAGLFARLRERHGERGMQTFAECAGLLISAAQEGFTGGSPDIVGEVYMQLEIGNVRAGQYFTPWDVASVMARMTIPDGADAVHARIKAAAQRSPLGQAVLLGSLMARSAEEAERYFFGRLLPAVMDDVEPITVCDPCCGSGIMLLAAAAQFPAWAVHLGLVQFYGQDIDATCVRMARINSLVYGLRSSKVSLPWDLAGPERRAYGEAVTAAYDEATAAIEAGEPPEAVRAQVAARLYGPQLSLFDADAA